MDERENLVDLKEKHKKYIPKRGKCVLLFLSYCFWISGAIFAAIGGYTISQNARYGSLSEFATDPGAVIAALGCFIFIISTFGVLGSLRENLCYLKAYKICLIVILVFELCTGLVGFAFWPELKKVADFKFREAIVKYDDSTGLRFMIDQIQRQFECCGSLTVDDWDSSRYYKCQTVASYRSCGVPWSCCHVEFHRNRQCGLGVRGMRLLFKMEDRIHTRGCLDKLFEFIKLNMFLIGGFAIACNVPLIVGIFLTTRMMKQIKKIDRIFNEANEKNHWVENTNGEQQLTSVEDNAYY